MHACQRHSILTKDACVKAAPAEVYIEQVKWSLIWTNTQGGRPFRSFAILEPDWIHAVHRKIKEKVDKTGDPLFDYAPICPALYLANEPEVTKILIRLEKKDHFLYDQADMNLEFRRDKISDMLRSR